MKLFGQLIWTAVNVAALPVAVAADVVHREADPEVEGRSRGDAMTDPEIVEWLQSIASDSGAKYFSVDESEALDAAIARLSATCETCVHRDQKANLSCPPSQYCDHTNAMVRGWKPEGFACNQHTPRQETR